jgi:subtilisin family serine protease
MLVGGQALSASDHDRIVTFESGVSRLMQLTIVELSGSLVVHELPLIGGMAIQLPPDNLDAALALLLNQTLVVDVFEDLLTVVDPIIPLPLEQAPDEEVYPWGLVRTGVEAVHQEWPKYDGQGTTVAILDTGVDREHRELRSAFAGGYNALPGGGSSHDGHGHGTHMAGIIAAALDAKGIVGVAPRASIVAVKVLDNNGRGRTSDLIKGLQWVADQGIRLVNISLGFWGENPPLEQATNRLYQQGVIMIAAAGNRCSDDPGQEEGGGDEGEGGATGCDDVPPGLKSPARYSWVAAIGATDHQDQVTDYSLTGDIDVVAPGGYWSGQQILSTYPGDRYGLGSGTSPATAHVTGAAALLLQYGQLSFEQVVSLLRQTAEDLGDGATQQGAGRLDVESLVEAANN